MLITLSVSSFDEPYCCSTESTFSRSTLAFSTVILPNMSRFSSSICPTFSSSVMRERVFSTFASNAASRGMAGFTLLCAIDIIVTQETIAVNAIFLIL